MAKVLVIGPTPPPFHGVATFIRDLLEAAPRNAGFQFDHLDTSDRRDASNIGRWDAANLTLGFASLAQMASRLVRTRHDLVYVPISQNRLGLLRDSLFLLAARATGRRRYIHLHGAHFADFYRDAGPARGPDSCHNAMRHSVLANTSGTCSALVNMKGAL